MPRRLDLTGNEYSYLTVIRRAKGNSRYLTWECRCRCGSTVYADSRQRKLGTIASCEGCRELFLKEERGGKVGKIIGRGRPPADITGKQFGDWLPCFLSTGREAEDPWSGDANATAGMKWKSLLQV